MEDLIWADPVLALGFAGMAEVKMGKLRQRGWLFHSNGRWEIVADV